ncbi:MAG TPA: hypothetical protein VHT50_27875 [Mycobacterium sp.]|nr:hypothetical protein [Mycobacterium sp.]
MASTDVHRRDPLQHARRSLRTSALFKGVYQVANNSSGNGRTVNGAAVGPNPQHDPQSHLVSLPTTVTT